MGGGRGMGAGRGMGRGMGTGLGSQSALARVAISALAGTKAGRPAPARQGSCRMVAVVDEDRCSGCGICIDACPEQAISMNALASIDFKRCTGCGTCVTECPAEALSLGQQTPALRRGATG